MLAAKGETRNPKSEIRTGSPLHPPGRRGGMAFGFRISAFGFGLLLLALGCSGTGNGSVRGYGSELLDGIERRVLPNGLAIVVREDHRRPTLTAMLAYRVGSVNEPEGLTGVSHFFEHMVFKGSAKYKRGDIDSSPNRGGGGNNPQPP